MANTKWKNEGYISELEIIGLRSKVQRQKYQEPKIGTHCENSFLLVDGKYFDSDQASEFLKNGAVLTRIDKEIEEDYLVLINTTMFCFSGEYGKDENCCGFPEDMKSDDYKFAHTNIVLVKIGDGTFHNIQEFGLGYTRNPWKFRLKSQIRGNLI